MTGARPSQGRRCRLSAEAGFSMIELLIASVAAVTVLGATLGLMVSGLNVQTRDSEWALALQEDRTGLARMVRDLRQATSIEEANAGSILFLATIGGKNMKVKYDCGATQSGAAYSYKQCVRLSAEAGQTLPASGPAVAKYLVNGSEVFTYSPSAGSATSVTVKLEMPAKGNLKQVSGSRGYLHKVVLQDSAYMRNRYLEG
jgi:Tfp pilus assembly protein PilW